MSNNPELDTAHRIIENTGMHLFLTGKAGTGKTTFLKELKRHSPKRMIVLAPTGIAAINAEGMTIHSFFQLPFAPYIPDTVFNAGKNAFRYHFSKEKKRIIRSMDLLVIDEISMVRADLLDAVDSVLRRYRSSHLPFGGVQLLMIGDLQQLAPVVTPENWEILSQYYDTPFFFSSRALAETSYATIELQQTYRQTDAHFLSLLNQIRENRADERTINELNKRYIPDFTPPAGERYIRLCTHNHSAQLINEKELSLIQEPKYTYKAEITGKFPELSYPTDEVLELKKGAQVMFIKNDHSPEKRYFNGMIGEVISINEQSFTVLSKDYPMEIEVEEEVWNNSRFVLNEESMEITEEIDGAFKQFPIRLAWAITIHKSQGLTFSHAIIDAHDSFAHGQVYVALSRCRTLEGMVLSTPLNNFAIIHDNAVAQFSSDMARRIPNDNTLLHWEKSYVHQLLMNLFDFNDIRLCIDDLLRLTTEHFKNLYPQTIEQLRSVQTILREKITDVAHRFAHQYTTIISQTPDSLSSTFLQERLHQAAKYFAQEIAPIHEMADALSLPHDNKAVKKKAIEEIDNLNKASKSKLLLLEYVRDNGFHTQEYLKQKAVIMLKSEGNDMEDSQNAKNSAAKSGKKPKANIPSDIAHPQLYENIIKWRTAKAAVMSLPAYCILQQKAVLGISNLLPTSLDAMLQIPYLGKVGIDKYGAELLEIVLQFMQENDLDSHMP